MKEQNEEISIWEVLSFFKKIVTYSKSLLRKLAIFWVVIFAIAYAYYSLSSRNYLSEMYVSSKNMSREELSSQIIYLNKLIQYKGHDELALLLGITPQDAVSLVSFQIEPYILEENTENQETNKSTQSRITVKSKTNLSFKLLNNTLTDYLNNSAYSEMLNSSQKDRLIKLKNTYTAEIKKLDSLENRSSSFKMRRDDDLGILFDGPSEIAKARISLMEKIAQTEKDLRTDIGVKVVKEFYIPTQPFLTAKPAVVIIAYIVVLGLSYCFLSFLYIIRHRLKNYEATV